MARRGCLLALCLWMLLRMVWSASVVLELGLKAYCVGEIMLWSRRCFMSCLLMMVSKILAMIGRSEMGR